MGQTTGTENGRLDQGQWEAIGYIKDESVLSIRNTFGSLFSYGIEEAPCGNEIADISFIGRVNWAG